MKRQTEYEKFAGNPLNTLAKIGRARIEYSSHPTNPNDVFEHDKGDFTNSVSWEKAKRVLEKRHPGVSEGIEIAMALALPSEKIQVSSGFQWRGTKEVPENPLMVQVSLYTMESGLIAGDQISISAKPRTISVSNGAGPIRTFRGINRVKNALSALYRQAVDL